MRRNLILPLLLLTTCTYTVKAQTYLTNVNGVVAETKDLSDISGNSYSTDDWVKGSVILNNAKVYNDLELKYSEYEDKLRFKGQSGDMMDFAEGVKEFTLTYQFGGKTTSAHYRNGYNDMPGAGVNAYFEVLVGGKIQLLKRTTKKVQQQVVYPSTTSNKSFQTTTRYYIVDSSNKGSLISRDQKSILSVLSDKRTELETYIKQNNLNLKKDEDLAKLITYYNSI